MQDPLLAQEIASIVRPPPGMGRAFLEGPPGAGKTTLAVRRLLYLLQSYVPADSILVLVPQRALGTPYREALWELDMPGGEVTVVTVGGLARRMVDLFWPLVGATAGFAHPNEAPIFLTLETTQYYMDRVVSPYIDSGYFDGISIRRNRLVSQIIDNLNKAAVAGYPHTEVASRLGRAWEGESARLRVYEQAQACATAFRAFCLQHNLLDFSLQYEVFHEHVVTQPMCRRVLQERYRHLIVDNVEEDTPRAHDLVREWLPTCDTALIVMDRGGGYRAFLGADPVGAAELKRHCDNWLALRQSHVMSPEVDALSGHLLQSMGSRTALALGEDHALPARASTRARSALHFEITRFQPQMYQWVGDQVADLIAEQGIPPEEIAILAPFVGDALRFSLTDALSHRGIAVRSHRPSRALRDEPTTRCLLTLVALSHPTWHLAPALPDVAQALMIAIDGLDLVRARLLTEITYRVRGGEPTLSSFDQIRPDVQERIGFVTGERFEALRRQLAASADEPALRELDAWIGALFTDALSQPGFGFHQNLDAGQVCSNLIESVRKFRRAVAHTLPEGDESYSPLSVEYVRMVERGIIAATYVQNWELEPAGAVLIAPAYTFLMSNRAVEIQFWLDIGSSGWWERLYQPLTHPYVLGRHWPEGKVWTDEDEYAARETALGRLVMGLVRRCRKGIYLGVAELGEQGHEQRGPLLEIIQRTLRRLPGSAGADP
ncbi:MAG: ATP-dependent helicase [Anaerolineae bacterium]|nr:ATP-dependent helicase [Anaerolineae bacterium]